MGSTKTLAAALAGVASPAAAWSLGHAAGHKDHGSMVALDDVEWAPARPGSPVGVAVPAGDPATGAHVGLVELPAGYAAPDRAQTGGYRGVSLTETWRRVILETGESRELPPRSYVFQPGGEMHGDTCVGDVNCVPMPSQSVAADFIPRR